MFKTKARPPKHLPGQIAYVGVGTFGSRYKKQLAAALGVSRSTLHLWLRGIVKRRRDIEADLLLVIDRERVAAGARAVELGALRDQMSIALERSGKDKEDA